MISSFNLNHPPNFYVLVQEKKREREEEELQNKSGSKYRKDKI